MKNVSTFLSWGLLLLVAVLCFPAGHAVAAEPIVGGSLVVPFLGMGLISIFDTRTMIEGVEQMNRPSRWLQRMFFPPAAPSDTEALDVDIVKGGRTMAPIC